MLIETAEVLAGGDVNGSGMPFRLRLPSGLEILGLPTKNFYGGNWDLGPTWNYLVLADRPFLVDTGRTGTGKELAQMMERAGFNPRNLQFILLSHGHEDHDGGLVELLAATGVYARAHHLYSTLIRFYPDRAPAGKRENFPPSCWHCFMPEEFTRRNCLNYHRDRQELEIREIHDGRTKICTDIECLYLPGHSPDALAVFLGNEAVILGDTVLPEITPVPSRESFFDQIRPILAPERANKPSPYGLRTYLGSLKSLRLQGERYPGILPLPGHRLFSGGHWNEFSLVDRIDELFQHHVDRCTDILHILKNRPHTARGIAKKHFDERLLKGFGILMAEHEILSHCELLKTSGDVCLQGDSFAATGSENFESLISSLEPWEEEN